MTDCVLVFDLGASHRSQGHLRLALFQSDGFRLAEWDSCASPEPFTCSTDLVKGIQSNIASLLAQHPTITLTCMVGLVCSRVSGNRVAMFSNLYTIAGERLTDVDFSPLAELAPTVHVYLDTMAALADVVSQHHTQTALPPMLPGYHGLYFATGGGIAMGEILAVSPEAYLLKVHERKPRPLDPPYDIHQPVIAANPLDEVIACIVPGYGGGHAPLKILVDYELSRQYAPECDYATWCIRSQQAIATYLEVLAHWVATKTYEGLTECLLSGPFHRGLNAYLQELPLDNATRLSKLPQHWPEMANHLTGLPASLALRVLPHLDQMGRQLSRANHFRVSMGPVVHDNTSGGWQLSQHAQPMLGRSNWVLYQSDL